MLEMGIQPADSFIGPMTNISRGGSRWRRFLAIALGVVALSSVVIVAGYYYLAGQAEASFKQHLERNGREAANAIVAENHASITDPAQIDTEFYEQQLTSLRNVFRSQGIAHVYTVRPTDTGYEYVLCPTPKTLDAEFNQTVRPLAEASLDQLPPEVPAVLDSGQMVVSKEHISDKLGIRKAIIAPIINANGQTQAIVVVERDYSAVIAQLSHLREIGLMAVVGSLLLGLLIAFLTLDARRYRDEMKSSSRVWSVRPYAEAILMITAAAIFVDGLLAQMTSGEKRATLERFSETLPVLYAADEMTQKMIDGSNQKTALLVADELDAAGEGALAAQFREAYSARVDNAPDASTRLDDLRSNIKSRLNNMSGDLSTVISDQSKLTSRTDRTMLGAIILSVMTFIFMRIASFKDKELGRVLLEKYKADQDYKQVVENVPVGLLIWRDGQTIFLNSTLHDLLEVERPEPSPEEQENAPQPMLGQDIFSRVLDRDRAELISALETCGKTPEPLECGFRVMTSNRRLRHLVLRGKPVYSSSKQLLHVLSFIVDITASVESRTALQQKNEEIKLKNEMLEGALEQIENSLESVVQSLVRAVEAKDPYTAGHSERVMQYSLWIGEELGLGPYEMRMLELGTLVHDIGKIGIPDEILTKPDRLTAEEFATIKSHPEVGHQILSDIEMFRDCLPIVRWHHEKLDGSGYPDGITSDEIPFLVRISTVADMFDAMTSSRSYREGMTLEKVIGIMEEDVMNGKLDPIVMGALKTVVERTGVIEQSDEARRADKAA